MAINTFARRYLLRNNNLFDNIIEEVAIDHARTIRDVEADTVAFHAERLAIAEKILGGDRADPVVAAFYRELKDRAVRAEAILNAAFASGDVNADGVPVPHAEEITDTMLRAGIASEWNATALIAWPTIVADLDAIENPPAEEPPTEEPMP